MNKFYTKFLVLIIGLLVVGLGWREKVWQDRMRLVSSGQIANRLIPISTGYPTPDPASENFEIKAKLIYPLNGSTVPETRPTIIGKVNQPEDFLLHGHYELKNFVHYNDQSIHRGISFYPSMTINRKITLDGELVENVHGFPQYPYVLCRELTEGEYVPKISVEECAKEKLPLLPPVIFMLQPTKKLEPGTHRLKLEVADRTFDFHFTVDPNYQISRQNLPKQLPRQYFQENFLGGSFFKSFFDISVSAGHNDPVRNKIDQKLNGYGQGVLFNNDFLDADRCGTGYHYPPEYLPVPLPLTQNDNVYYKLHLPYQPNHLGARMDKQVNIKIGMTTYDLKFTDPSNFYFYDEIWRQDDGRQRISGKNAFYIPIRNLVFTQSEESLERFIDDDEKFPVVFNYLEFSPYDYSGRGYRENVLLYRTVNSTSCDG